MDPRQELISLFANAPEPATAEQNEARYQSADCLQAWGELGGDMPRVRDLVTGRAWQIEVVKQSFIMVTDGVRVAKINRRAWHLLTVI